MTLRKVALGSAALTLVATGLVMASAVSATAVTPAAHSVRTFSSHTLLDKLTVGATYHAGYVRSKFSLWSEQPDGCNTRYEVLIRDAVVKPHVGAGCYLTGGKWVSPYDGYRTKNPTNIQIDHVVPLAVAWGSGAWRWSAATREAFANDIGTRYDLLAVSGHSNESKGDSGPDEWLPSRKSFDCRYMTDYTAVLWRWHLHIDPAQKSFLTNHLRACGWPAIKAPARPTIHRRPAGGGGRSGNTATGIRITAINFDSPGSDTGGNTSLNGEWVQVTNTSAKVANVSQWVVHDTSDHRYTFRSFRLKAHAAVKIHTGAGSDTAKNVYWGSTGYIWNNTGDTATLDNANGTKVDSCSYTESADPQASC